ncbi:DgyrCDS313 [Dimorphilus gyrociliatus]|uniref:Lipid scramblase CLPTM1L n=1 Tax=Dimorphilus gyrociliatus TaxID=2664684 RepID=A0A7I8V6R7_9ANNE|nr:DgyrCDS313 [Dimorphilus gyrociliatus]
MFFPQDCPVGQKCLGPFLARNPEMELKVYTSRAFKLTHGSAARDLKLIWNYSNFSFYEEVTKELEVDMPRQTRKNGSLYIHAALVMRGEEPFTGRSLMSYAVTRHTTYTPKQAEAFKLMTENSTAKKAPIDDRPISHWRSKLYINVMANLTTFDYNSIPSELHQFIRITESNEYMPFLYLNELSNRVKDLMPLNQSAKTMPLTIHYSPISLGKMRLFVTMQQSIEQLHTWGFSEKDGDEIKGIFVDTDFYLLMLTFMVAAFHMLFDILAFKNDFHFWKGKKNMVGLSTRTVLWRCFSTIIIFFYLLDEKTSLLVLIPCGVSVAMELWKLTKAFKLKITWSGLKPKFELGTTTDKEKDTLQFDRQAMKYLSYVLYPLCLGGAIYSLLYTPHKGWYSWCIQSLVNGVYAFGFLFMLPQLFVNYQLKSVEHLPWRTFMYKAFNTFIDDVFAFIITMPTSHRLACFRDDAVFLIYLYQRYLYPVDKKRVNEYGQTFEDDQADKKDK